MEFRDRVRNLRSLQGGSPSETALLESHVAGYLSATPSSGHNLTYRVALANGTIAFHKPFAGINFKHAHDYGHRQTEPPLHECAAWRLAAALGKPISDLVACCVLRPIAANEGSLSERRVGRPSRPEPLQTAAHQVAPAAFFDSLIGQQDRHGGNYRWHARDSSLGLIDHGYSFAKPGDILNESVFVKWRWQLQRQDLDPSEATALGRLTASSDLLGLSLILEPERSDALRERAEEMQRRGAILRAGEY